MDEIMFEECVGDRLAGQEWLLDCRSCSGDCPDAPPRRTETSGGASRCKSDTVEGAKMEEE